MAVADQKEKSAEWRTAMSVFVFVPMTVNLIIAAMFVLGAAN